MIVTSAAIPPVALWPAAPGRAGRLGGRRSRGVAAARWRVLFDRDGTLINNVPYLADPEGCGRSPGARRTLALSAGAGVAGRVWSATSPGWPAA